MVYDATKSGLNEALWAPSFGLPTVDQLVRGPTSWMGGIDLCDRFLNYCLDPAIQPYCGVDLKPFFHDELKGQDQQTLKEHWSRCMMGLKPSPYVCVKGQHLADEIIHGGNTGISVMDTAGMLSNLIYQGTSTMILSTPGSLRFGRRGRWQLSQSPM
jgi:hypothetical protein